jgi:rfaE bifunctional protein kinase chain/domain
MKIDSQKLFSHKIKNTIEIAEIIKKNKGIKKSIMCHGTFDVVHPGHIRHLLYAKTKASILIASLTSDMHIKKSNMRPYVPEELRAINLAALEMVDYVLIDKDETPLKNLKIIKPDFFAKGYEYTSGEVNPKTKDELKVLESYGGEIIFTPGDIVYSSSKLIELSPPSIAMDKLMMLMEAEKIEFNDLRETLKKIKKIKIHVVGDSIVDGFSYCSMAGGMTKTPTMSVKFENQVNYVGGAGVVAKHIKAAGAQVLLSTVLGDDENKDFFLKDIQSFGVEVNAIIDQSRPTTYKNAVIVKDYRLIKIDTLDNRSISENIKNEICDKIKSVKSDGIIFSDFRHGIFNRDTIPCLVNAINPSIYKVADSQVASRWGNILEFQNFDLITPNEREARFATGDQDSVIRPLAKKLHYETKCKILMLKCGERGLMTYRSNKSDDFRSFFVIDSLADRVIDPVGAGDALLAYSSLSMIVSKNEVISSILGSIAAGIECGFDGNHPVTQNLILEKINKIEKEILYQ